MGKKSWADQFTSCIDYKQDLGLRNHTFPVQICIYFLLQKYNNAETNGYMLKHDVSLHICVLGTLHMYHRQWLQKFEISANL